MESKTYTKLNPDTFCSAPWFSLQIDAHGKCSFCSFTTESYDAADNDWLDWYQGQHQGYHARSKFLDGAWPAPCERCKTEEQRGFESYRYFNNSLASIFPGKYWNESLKQSTVWPLIQSNTISQKPKSVTATLTNHCDKACLMCPSYSSSSVAEIYGLDKISDWSQDSKLWCNFLDLTVFNPNLERLHIMSGEPFIQPKFWELVDLLGKYKKDIIFQVNTNGMHINADMIEKFAKFRICVIDISLESLAESNDYIRRGCSWRKVKNNVESIISIKPDTVNLHIRNVAQALSARDLWTLIDWCNDKKLRLSGQKIHDNRHFGLDVLPTHIKEQIWADLDQRYPQGKLDHYLLGDQVNRIKSWLRSPIADSDQQHLQKIFVKNIRYRDRLDGKDIKQVYPEWNWIDNV